MSKETAKALQALHLKGIKFYKDYEVNISPERRVNQLREAIQGWNRCQRIIDGKSTT